MTTDFSGKVRRAQLNDKNKMIDTMNICFSSPERPMDFLNLTPYCFTDERIPNHFIYETLDGKIAGAAGIYPYEMNIHGVTFEMAGIGQVSTLPEYREKGIMKQIFAEVCREANKYDFTWLGGDRRRYGFYGWELGGRKEVYRTFEKYLIDPPAQVQPLTVDDMPFLNNLLRKEKQFVYFSETEVSLMMKATQVQLYKYNSSVLATTADGSTVIFAGGIEKEISGMISWACMENLRAGRWELTIFCPPEDCPLRRVCMQVFHRRYSDDSENLRVGNIYSLAQKIGKVVSGKIPKGHGELQLANSDNGEDITIIWSNGALKVKKGAVNPVPMNTRQLSTLFFSTGGIDYLLPELPPDSVLCSILPFPIYMSQVYAL
ncbi:MAG: GNAT family N-acetyltransferase [bacterium]